MYRYEIYNIFTSEFLGVVEANNYLSAERQASKIYDISIYDITAIRTATCKES